eukprot:gene23038-30233_t
MDAVISGRARRSVCGLAKLYFEPPVIYCSYCGIKLKRSQVYYTTPMDGTNDLKARFCRTPCYTSADPVTACLTDGAQLKKSDLQKRKNDDEIEEAWVACDQCENWVHMVCAMFNKGRNNNDVHYLCPECLLEGMESGTRASLDISAGARSIHSGRGKDLAAIDVPKPIRPPPPPGTPAILGLVADR